MPMINATTNDVRAPPRVNASRAQQDPDAPRNDHAMIALYTKLAYQRDLVPRTNTTLFSPMYTTPIFKMPSNYLGVVYSRHVSEGGNEHRSSSTFWGNDGRLKIPEAWLLKHKPNPFLVHN